MHALCHALDTSGTCASSGVTITHKQGLPVKVQEVARELRGVANGGCGGRMVRPPAKACRCRFRPKGGLPPAASLQDVHSSSGQKAAEFSTHDGTAAVTLVTAVPWEGEVLPASSCSCQARAVTSSRLLRDNTTQLQGA